MCVLSRFEEKVPSFYGVDPHNYFTQTSLYAAEHPARSYSGNYCSGMGLTGKAKMFEEAKNNQIPI